MSDSSRERVTQYPSFLPMSEKSNGQPDNSFYLDELSVPQIADNFEKRYQKEVAEREKARSNPS